MVEKENKERKIIDCHPELIEILDRLDPKISEVTWGAIGKTSYLIKTQILARKIKASKLKI
jgi:hypothetical protein